MRITLTLPILLTTLGCDELNAGDRDGFARGDRTERVPLQDTSGPIRESPLTPLRERGGPPPEASIQAFCLDEVCSTMVFSAAASENATSFEWLVDGEDAGSNTELVLDLADEDGDGVPDPTEVVEIELIAVGSNPGNAQLNQSLNAAGSDSATVALLTLPFDPLDPGPPEDPRPPGSTNIVVVEVGGCADPVGIVSFQGCLISGSGTTHEVIRITPQVTTSGNLVYDPVQSRVTQQGLALAAVWNATGSNLQYDYWGGATPATYGNGRGFTYQAIAGPNDVHLTSYYELGKKNILQMKAHHFLGDPNQYSWQSWLQVDCSGNRRTPEVSYLGPVTSDS